MPDCRITMKLHTLRQAEEQESGNPAHPAPGGQSNWKSLIGRGILLLLLLSLGEAWIPPPKKPLRPLFGMPLTGASHCLAGYHRFISIEHGLFVCQTCNLVCACPYCVAVIPAGVPFVNCAYHREAYLELQDTQAQQTAGTVNGRRI